MERSKYPEAMLKAFYLACDDDKDKHHIARTGASGIFFAFRAGLLSREQQGKDYLQSAIRTDIRLAVEVMVDRGWIKQVRFPPFMDAHYLIGHEDVTSFYESGWSEESYGRTHRDFPGPDISWYKITGAGREKEEELIREEKKKVMITEEGYRLVRPTHREKPAYVKSNIRAIVIGVIIAVIAGLIVAIVTGAWHPW